MRPHVDSDGSERVKPSLGTSQETTGPGDPQEDSQEQQRRKQNQRHLGHRDGKCSEIPRTVLDSLLFFSVKFTDISALSSRMHC